MKFEVLEQFNLLFFTLIGIKSEADKDTFKLEKVANNFGIYTNVNNS